MKRLTLAMLLAGCAPEAATPARTSGPVDVPPWAEGTETAAPSKTIATAATTTVSLGTDAQKPVFRGKRIDLDLVGADLPNVCRLIGELAGVNVVVADGVAGTVTVKMKNVPWEDALDAILLSKGYVKERVGSVIVVRAH
ncbi:MAG: secretin and TonB N-terminal domain-containing protein [Polyangiales bacterium]